jgi:hypothetical protein
MRTKYLKLTKEQKARGVYFSSELVVNGERTIRHEIINEDYYNNDWKEATEKEARLRDVSFFKNWGHDSDNEVVHEIRTR